MQIPIYRAVLRSLSLRDRRSWQSVTVSASRSFVTRSTGCLFRCLPAAVLSVAAQKVPKEAAQRGVERLAPARRATPPRPPQARPFVFASTHLCFLRGACNLRASSNSTTGKRIDFYLGKRLDKFWFIEQFTDTHDPNTFPRGVDFPVSGENVCEADKRGPKWWPSAARSEEECGQ